MQCVARMTGDAEGGSWPSKQPQDGWIMCNFQEE
jgi:hypothetical protein